MLRLHSLKFIVLTGGPGAGKTAVMEVARQLFCEHVSILPESASIVYSGGFPRGKSDIEVRAAQRTIVRVQEELERMTVDQGFAATALCDRGIMDGAAYWPGGRESFCDSIGLTKEQIFARYFAVIHMRTPGIEKGYNYANPMRIESPEQAATLDCQIEAAWEGHPNRIIVDATESFSEKVDHVTNIIRAAMANCCEHSRGLHAKVSYQTSLLQ